MHGADNKALCTCICMELIHLTSPVKERSIAKIGRLSVLGNTDCKDDCYAGLTANLGQWQAVTCWAAASRLCLHLTVSAKLAFPGRYTQCTLYNLLFLIMQQHVRLKATSRRSASSMCQVIA